MPPILRDRNGRKLRPGERVIVVDDEGTEMPNGRVAVGRRWHGKPLYNEPYDVALQQFINSRLDTIPISSAWDPSDYDGGYRHIPRSDVFADPAQEVAARTIQNAWKSSERRKHRKQTSAALKGMHGRVGPKPQKGLPTEIRQSIMASVTNDFYRMGLAGIGHQRRGKKKSTPARKTVRKPARKTARRPARRRA